MINKEGGFYLMKDPAAGYKNMTTNGEKSSLYVLIEAKDSVPANKVSKGGSIYQNTTSSRRTTSSSRSSSGGSSSGSSSGGY